MNMINNQQFLESPYLETFTRFWVTNNIRIEERSDTEFLVRASGKVEGLDTTKIFPSFAEAVKYVGYTALGVRRAAAA